MIEKFECIWQVAEVRQGSLTEKFEVTSFEGAGSNLIYSQILVYPTHLNSQQFLKLCKMLLVAGVMNLRHASSLSSYSCWIFMKLIRSEYIKKSNWKCYRVDFLIHHEFLFKNRRLTCCLLIQKNHKYHKTSTYLTLIKSNTSATSKNILNLLW